MSKTDLVREMTKMAKKFEDDGGKVVIIGPPRPDREIPPPLSPEKFIDMFYPDYYPEQRRIFILKTRDQNV